MKELNEKKMNEKKMNEKELREKEWNEKEWKEIPDGKEAGAWKIMRKVWALYEKEREVFWYLVCGAGTTVVNLATYWLCVNLLRMPTAVSTSVAWLFSVTFAYVTNRTFVFRSTNRTLQSVLKEIGTFFGARVCSGALDVVLMVCLVDMMHFPQMWMKVFVNVLVTVLNYIFSKCIVFRKRDRLAEMEEGNGCQCEAE